MTAVEWLYNNLKSHFEHDGDLLEVVQISFNIAKEMEMQQIIEARVTAPLLDTCSKNEYIIEAEQYYNETFKNK